MNSGKERIMPPLKIEDIEVPIPVIQGGMSVGISLSGLASAVTNAGGIGVIGAAGIGMLEPDFDDNFRKSNRRVLRREIEKAKANSEGPIGVNIMMALNDSSDLARTASDADADLLLVGAGLPLGNYPLDYVREAGTKTVPIVSSPRAASLICRYWSKHYETSPDAMVVEGPKAGGHLGFKKEELANSEPDLERIVPQVIEALDPYREDYGKDIPVIAAGGIFTGGDIRKFLQLGANGVQMATRFVATEECDAANEFKLTYVKANEPDINIIESPVGLPGRAISNKFLEEVEEGDKSPRFCNWQCLENCDRQDAPYCILSALKNAKLGRMEDGFAFAGANAYRIEEISTVPELMDNLQQEYRDSF